MSGERRAPRREEEKRKPLMPSPAEEEVASSYSLELSDLTFNSRPIISALTMIADESINFSATIARVVLDKIASAPPSQKLPVIYLLDSISKNVRRDYLRHFAPRLPDTIGDAFVASDPKVRASMHKLLKTWTGVFPAEVLARVAARFSSAEIGEVPVLRDNAGSQPAAPPAPKRARHDAPTDAVKTELKRLMMRVCCHLH